MILISFSVQYKKVKTNKKRAYLWLKTQQTHLETLCLLTMVLLLMIDTWKRYSQPLKEECCRGGMRGWRINKINHMIMWSCDWLRVGPNDLKQIFFSLAHPQPIILSRSMFVLPLTYQQLALSFFTFACFCAINSSSMSMSTTRDASSSFLCKFFSLLSIFWLNICFNLELRQWMSTTHRRHRVTTHSTIMGPPPPNPFWWCEMSVAATTVAAEREGSGGWTGGSRLVDESRTWGPNDGLYVVWALGMFFFESFLFIC